MASTTSASTTASGHTTVRVTEPRMRFDSGGGDDRRGFVDEQAARNGWEVFEPERSRQERKVRGEVVRGGAKLDPRVVVHESANRLAGVDHRPVDLPDDAAFLGQAVEEAGLEEVHTREHCLAQRRAGGGDRGAEEGANPAGRVDAQGAVRRGRRVLAHDECRVTADAAVEGERPFEVRLEQDVAVDHEKRPVALEKPARAADAAGRAANPTVLPNVAQADAERRAIAECGRDGLGEVVQVHDDVTDAGRGEPADGVLDERPAEDGNERLGQLLGEWAQAGTEAGAQDHGFHWPVHTTGGATAARDRPGRGALTPGTASGIHPVARVNA
jgi:hypothetical protein